MARESSTLSCSAFLLPTPFLLFPLPTLTHLPSLVPLHSAIPQCVTSIQATCQNYMKVWMRPRGHTTLHRPRLHPSLPWGGCSEGEKARGLRNPSYSPVFPSQANPGAGAGLGRESVILPASGHQGPGATLHRDCPAGV